METSLINIWQVSDILVRYVREAPVIVLLAHTAIIIVLYHVAKVSFILTSMFLQRARRKSIAQIKTTFSREGVGARKILIAGDSTGVGTGANNPSGTFASLLSRDFPRADVYNVATNGALTRDIIGQLEKYKYIQQDAIVISTGGNDLWSLITMRRLRKDLVSVLDRAKMMSNGHVVLLFFGNAGSAPLFPFLVRKLLLSREKKALKIFTDVCQKENVTLVELFTNKNGNPFVEDPKRYFSPDGLHPSSEGYALWYECILKTIREKGYLS